MVDMNKAKLNPARVFASPHQVTEEGDLTHKEKVEILKRWEYDSRELQVATEENMPGSNTELLDNILKELEKLGAISRNRESRSPTKHG